MLNKLSNNMSNDPDQFNILRKINKDPSITQRKLATELNLVWVN